MSYVAIAFFASVVGAISGLGGGVIIKPMLDLCSDLPITNIAILSSFTVFFMSLTTLAKHIGNKSKVTIKITLFLSVGAILGGSIGNHLLDWAVADLAVEQVQIIQSLGLALLLTAVMIYMHCAKAIKQFIIKNSAAILLIGLLLGAVSSFFGIGGGPINMVVLTLFFSMTTKEAAVNSILMILLSQGSKLANVWLFKGFEQYDLQALWWMIPAAILGGLLGANLNKILSEKKIIVIFNGILLFVIAVNGVNLFRAMAV